jgi:tripartite-type tricarboxylate transporter receptor subunit TctC
MKRRTFLHVAAGAATLPVLPRLASAQAYPTRPVRIVVGFTAGGIGDVLARLVGQWLSERLGQQFIIENRPGAGATLAAEAVIRAMPDGYTLLWVSSANSISAAVYSNLSFDFIRDTSAVSGVMSGPLVMEVNPSVPARTVPEFITYAKANPGKLSMASAGNGTQQHVAGELFKMMTGISMIHVPYRGAAPMLTDLLGGQVQVSFDNLASSLEYIRTGKMRALAVTAAIRSAALPDVPTVQEFVPGYEASSLFGVVAPRNAPGDIVEKLNKEINAGLADPRIKARIADLGGGVLTGSPADFGRLIAEDTEKWAKVVKFAGIKAE